MIEFISTFDGPPISVHASIRGMAIYLDTFAVIGLAKDDLRRRQRFLDTLYSGADVLFSVSTVAELSRLPSHSIELVRSFLNEMGPHWFPVELNATEVVNREKELSRASVACLSQQFVNDYFRIRMQDLASQTIISLSDDFARLGPVLDWVTPQRDSIRKGTSDMDDALIKKISGYRSQHERDSSWLDGAFPKLSYDSVPPATFVYVNLIRSLILEAKGYQLKKNDGLDFCHTVIGSAFASVATLDKQWKRRVANLPKPNRAAPVFCANELDKMVGLLESEVKIMRDTQALGMSAR
jgi:hypothetical protein